jgi:hypothetical protein
MRKLVVLAVLFFSLGLPLFALAQLDPDSSGLTTTGGAAYGEKSPEELDPAVYIGRNILQPVLGLTGLIFLVLTVYAGFLWLTSAGNEKQIARAKQILVAAVAGTVIMASAYAITSTVLSALADRGPTTDQILNEV